MGPLSVFEATDSAPGVAIRGTEDAEPFSDGMLRTFVVDLDGVLRLAPRETEHVACAGKGDVLAAGELALLPLRGSAARMHVTWASNQSTGYCPEPSSWCALASALDRAGIVHGAGFDFDAVFRRCTACGERNLVKDDWLECALCGATLPTRWNFEETVP